MIEFKNIKKVYNGNILAVDNFNLKTDKKEFVIFVGPSGCGKSTTLRMMAGLEDITEGEIFIDSKQISNVHPKDRDIAMVFQNYALYPHMTVYDNIAFPLKMRKVHKKEIQKRVEETAIKLDLTEYLNRKPKEISGGQRQRVALGRAIIRSPKIFLLDEPLSNLDAKLRTKMRTELIQLYQSLDATFIYVTHDQIEAMTMGSVIVVMKDGRIQQTGSPQYIYDNPENLFVATFMGSPQMNILSATLHRDETGYYLKLMDNRINIDSAKLAKNPLVKDYIGKKILFGIRPNALKIPKNDNDDGISVLSCTVEIVELMGSENILYVNFMDKKLIVITNPENKPNVGDKIKLSFTPNKIHLFDSETEEVISN